MDMWQREIERKREKEREGHEGSRRVKGGPARVGRGRGRGRI